MTGKGERRRTTGPLSQTNTTKYNSIQLSKSLFNTALTASAHSLGTQSRRYPPSPPSPPPRDPLPSHLAVPQMPRATATLFQPLSPPALPALASQTRFVMPRMPLNTALLPCQYHTAPSFVSQHKPLQYGHSPSARNNTILACSRRPYRISNST